MATPASHLKSATPRIQALPDSEFLVGIDLGTTNCAVAAVDTRARRPRVTLFRIPQLTEPSVVAARSLLPSFLYFAEPHEIAGGVVALPWNPTPDAIAGVLARERGALAPARQVASAKSWLAHPAVDRRAAILPWGTDSPPLDFAGRCVGALSDAHPRRLERDDRGRRSPACGWSASGSCSPSRRRSTRKRAS